MGKFDAKAFEVIFVGYSNTSKAYRVFNKLSLTIEESMHVKFEESNTFVKNVVEIDSLGEYMEKITLKDSPIEEEKPKIDVQSEDQEVEVEPPQPLLKDWRFTPHHPKDLIIGDVSKGVTTRSKLHDFMHLFLMLNPRTSSKPRPIHIGCLQCKKSSINLSANQV